MNNWDSLPTKVIMKLDPDYMNKLGRFQDIKVDIRSVSDSIDRIDRAVNITPFKMHALNKDLKAFQDSVNARLGRLEATVYRIEQLLLKSDRGSSETISPPPKKKTKMVSYKFCN